MKMYVPETLDMSTLDYPDKIACLTDLIYTMPVYRRDCDDGSLVPLNKTRLRQQFGQMGLEGAIEEATNLGIIYCDPSYSAGHRSKGYCIGQAYRDDDIAEYELTSGYVIRKIEAYQEKQEAAEVGELPIHGILREDLRKVQIDELSKENLRFYSEYDHDKYIANRIAYEKLRRGDYFCRPCKNGRLHTNVTNLNSGRSEQLTNGLRSHLHINGERLVKVDVKNCQPLLLTVLVKKYLVYKEEKTTKPPPTHKHHPYVVIQVDGEIQQYQEDCENGKFYEKAMTSLGWTRSQTKDAMIKLLFDRERDNRASHYFKQTYPHIFEFVCQFKSGYYTDLANELQKLESTMIIEGVCPRFKQEYPDIPLVTIHDCLCVPESFGRDRLKSAINLEFQQYGITPTLKDE